MRYWIEAKELSGDSGRRSEDQGQLRTVVEASDAEEAISQFVQDQHSELVSVTRPVQGRESIATVRRNEAVYLVRVYAA